MMTLKTEKMGKVTPKVEKWLEYVSNGDEDTLIALMELIGSAVVMGNPSGKEFFLIGNDTKRKNVFLDGMYAFMGENAYEMDFKDNFYMAKALGKLAIIVENLPYGSEKYRKLKRMAQGCVTDIRKPYHNYDYYRIHATVIVTADDFPERAAVASLTMDRGNDYDPDLEIDVDFDEYDIECLTRIGMIGYTKLMADDGKLYGWKTIC